MKRAVALALTVALLVLLAACSPYDPDMVIIVQNGTTAPLPTTPTDTTPTATAPAATTPAASTPATTPSATTPAATTPAVTTPIETTPAQTTAPIDWNTTRFVISISTGKFHLPSCHYVDRIKEENRREVVGTAEFTEDNTPCKVCLPEFDQNK
ncbi:MAG: hypothetical protein J6D21_00580 [Clostridia bacterium]|nr:hypothetical protein [Clostridia bacterium]